ncbi:LysM peptidoglycan-binding domain-containing protein [Demequina sp.]|uniref:LysM peptidoglycan-binding domain-containing protein n=1 Tax=Demequina sp. TaxID=2050685 RepID=UPI0025CC3442|nr:LysM peptidoglycan-binding domain-containing protein [Demequina sp.]
MPGLSPATGSVAVRAALGAALAGVIAVAAAAPAAADERHRVEPGDTVSALAHRYGATVSAISAANGLDSRATIYVGRTLVIPSTKATAAPKAKSATHVVASGDTVWALAQRYDVSVRAIVAANGLSANALIRLGQRLTIPGGGSAAVATPSSMPAAKAPAAKAPAAYTVRPGDTLSAIAARNGTTVAALARANSLANPSLIRVGQRLTIPGGAAAATGLVGDTFLGRTYPKDVVAAANQNKAALLATEVPSRAEMRRLVASTARRFGVDPALAQAVAYQESGFNMRAVSPANAIGVMQVIPTSGEWASDMAGRRLDLLDPEDNVLAGVLILRSLTRSFDRLDHAIGGYYQGGAAVRKHGLYPGTVTYVSSVKSLMSRFA